MGLSMEGNFHFQIDWASHIIVSKFTIFALFYFVFEVIFQVQAPGNLYLKGQFHSGFLCVLTFFWGGGGGLVFGGAYTWRGLF